MNSLYDLTSLPIDTSNPVVRSHPLNLGRIAWWLCLPPLDGGRQWFDLMGRTPGTLTGMTSTGGWRTSARPGAWGGMLFDGTDDTINCGNVIPATADMTIAFWYQRASAASGDRFAILKGAVGSNYTYGLYYDISNTRWTLFGNSNTNSFFTGSSEGSNTDWRQIVLTKSGTTWTLYRNGLSLSTITLTAGTTSSNLYLGGDPSTVYRWVGRLDDVGFWNRRLSAVEVRQLYDLSLQSYPGLLRRVVPWGAFMGGATSSRRRRLLTGAAA